MDTYRDEVINILVMEGFMLNRLEQLSNKILENMYHDRFKVKIKIIGDYNEFQPK